MDFKIILIFECLYYTLPDFNESSNLFTYSLIFYFSNFFFSKMTSLYNYTSRSFGSRFILAILPLSAIFFKCSLNCCIFISVYTFFKPKQEITIFTSVSYPKKLKNVRYSNKEQSRPYSDIAYVDDGREFFQRRRNYIF